MFLTYATAHGRTFLDRQLYQPKAWIFRRAVEETGLHYVLGMPATQAVVPEARPLAWHQVWAQDLIASLPAQAWRVRAAGNGAKGPRRYGWTGTRWSIEETFQTAKG